MGEGTSLVWRKAGKAGKAVIRIITIGDVIDSTVIHINDLTLPNST